MVIKMFIELKGIYEHSEIFNKKIENIKNNQSQLVYSN